MPKPKLFLIDSNAFCYRAYFAIKNLATSYGQPTNAVYGFVTMLKKILQKENPDYVGACFDVGRDTFRQKKYTDYKVHRPPMPDGLTSQIPIIKEVISAYNISIFEQPGYEADDVIATISQKAQEQDLDVFIVSSDKDILQLVDKNVKVYSPYKDEVKIYDKEAVLARFKIEPQRIADLIALMGDATDNIPGVKGIGETTAVKLLEEFKDLNGVYKNLDNIKSEKLRDTLKQQKQSALLSRELAILDTQVPCDVDFDKLKFREPDYPRLFDLYKELEFKSMLKELPMGHSEVKSAKVISTDKKQDLEKIEQELTAKDAQFVFFIPEEQSAEGAKIKEVLFCSQESEVVTINNLKSIKSILENESTQKTTYNLKQAMHALAHNDIAINGKVFDVMVAAYLLDSTKVNYLIEDIALQYLNVSIADAKINPQDLAVLLFRLKPILEKELQNKSLKELFCDVEMPLSSVLAKMELTGVKIDKALLKELSKHLEKRMIELIETIYDLAGTQFNINSPKQLGSVLFEKLKLPVIKRTKTGPSTDEEVLRRLSDKHKLPASILEYRQLVKLKSTYVDALPQLADPKTDKVHTSFSQTSTETGRLSSSEPNLQNLPIKTELGRKIRQAIIASRPQDLLLSADYSQIELRILAHLSKDENLKKAFEQGEDIHKFTASLIFNVKLDEVSDEMRDVAKRVNFGIIYGISAYGLSKDLGISQEEANGFIEAYFSRYPKVKDYMQAQIEKANKEGFVVTLLGRRRYIPQIASKNSSIRQFAERQAINTPVQGSAADLIKLAMIKLQDEIEERSLESKLILQVHDELVFDMPKKELPAIKDLVKDVMENVIKLSVPILVDIKVGINWLEMKSI